MIKAKKPKNVRWLNLLLVFVAISIAPSAASALPIQGYSIGDVVCPGGVCTNPVSDATTVTDTGVKWYSGQNSYSYLYAGPTGAPLGQDTFSAPGGGNDVKLASIRWISGDNVNDQTYNNFANWTVTITFTDPSGNYVFPANTLNVNLQNGIHTDTLYLDDISSISTANWLTGWNVTDLHFMLDNGDVLAKDANNNYKWLNTMGNTSKLWIVADFTKVVDPVPEPVSMLLFGTGLVGVGGYMRRKFKN